MEWIETESYIISPENEYDDVSIFPEDENVEQSFITQPIDDAGADDISVPAIIVDMDDDEVAEQQDGIKDQAESAEGDAADPKMSKLPANSATDSEAIDNIYSLLLERLPERQLSESESELESESEIESEKTLSDIYDEISQLNSYESEQLQELQTLNSNMVIHSNNDYYLGIYTISVISAIWGSIAIFLLFRKIG